MHVTLLGRHNCHLCDDAASLLLSVRERFSLEIEARDIDSDDELVKEYGLRIPVLLGPDGAVLAEGAITPESLVEALHGAAGAG